MNETIFSAASLAAAAGWVGLGLAVLAPPGGPRTTLLAIGGRFVPVCLCVLYVYLLVTHWGWAKGAGFSSLAEVLTLFSVPGKMLGGWVHFLVFDLLVGRWVVDDVLSSSRPRLLLLVALPTIFMYGPLGLLLYLLARSVYLASAPRTAR
ncbi:MAG: abscisic acid-deficient protein Aba4 family protein [Burkholderiaceae bacterium]